MRQKEIKMIKSKIAQISYKLQENRFRFLKITRIVKNIENM